MSNLRKLISCCLALSLAFAGAVAFSPVLHRLIDHGGHGRPHSHYRATRIHAPGHREARSTFRHTFNPFGLPQIDLSRLWHKLEHWLAGHAAESPAQDESGHEHHSLSQLLAGGLVEQTIDAPLFEVIFFVSIRGVALAENPLLDSNWDAQTATRGPPFIRS
jgi:hypothetical protein